MAGADRCWTHGDRRTRRRNLGRRGERAAVSDLVVALAPVRVAEAAVQRLDGREQQLEVQLQLLAGRDGHRACEGNQLDRAARSASPRDIGAAGAVILPGRRVGSVRVAGRRPARLRPGELEPRSNVQRPHPSLVRTIAPPPVQREPAEATVDRAAGSTEAHHERR